MRTRSLALVLALALPGLARAAEPPAEEPGTTQFAPLDLRDPDEAPAPEPAAEATEETTPPEAEAVAAPAPAPVDDAPLPSRDDPDLAASPAKAAAAEPEEEEEPLPVNEDGEVLASTAPGWDPEDATPFSAGLKADLLVPTSQVDSTGALSLELRYRLPVHQRRLAIAADVGWYPLGGDGKSVDPYLGTYAYEWSLDTVPIHLGVEYVPPLPFRLPSFLERLRPYGEGGLSMAFLWSTATYRNADGHAFIRDNQQDDTAFGWYLGLGALFRLGPGDVVGGYRYDGLKTDMDLPVANRDSGDVGGSHVQAGYRLVF